MKYILFLLFTFITAVILLEIHFGRCTSRMLLTFFSWTYYVFFKRSKTAFFDRKITASIFFFSAVVGHFLVGKYKCNCRLPPLIKVAESRKITVDQYQVLLTELSHSPVTSKQISFLSQHDPVLSKVIQ